MPTELQYKISKKFLVNEYIENKLSQDEIARTVGCSRWVISHRLKGFDIEIRNKTWKLSLYRTKYSANEKFFDKITPDVAWVLGWLLSDGFIRLRPIKYFGIAIRMSDQDVLLKIKKFLQYTGPLYKRSPYSRISSKGVMINCSGQLALHIHNEYVVDRLIALGLREKKSLNERFLKEIEEKDREDIFKSFIRGIF